MSMLLEDILEELGHASPVVCANVESALAALEAKSFDGAFLDLNLHGERADPVAESLMAKRIPFVIATGGVEDTKALGATALVRKPYRFADIEHAIGSFI